MISCRNNKAFTLIELLLALSIFAVAVLSFSFALRNGMFTYFYAEKNSKILKSVNYTVLRFQRDIRNTVSYNVKEFKGDQTEVSFVSITRNGGKDVSVRPNLITYTFDSGGILRTCSDLVENDSEETIYLEGMIDSGTFQYATFDSDDGDVKWVSSTDSFSSISIPKGIALEFAFEDAKGQGRTVRREIYLPQGGWSSYDE